MSFPSRLQRSVPWAALLMACWVLAPVARAEAPAPAWDGAAEAPRSLVLVTVSSLRADRVDGPVTSRIRTPRLAELAREGMLLRRARTPVPETVPALASLWTGLDPGKHRLYQSGDGPLPEGTLPERLAAAGFRCIGAVPPGPLARTPALVRGLHKLVVGESRDGPALAARALAAAAEVPGDQHLFLWLHLDDPAAPYPAVLSDLLEFAADGMSEPWRFTLPAGDAGLPEMLPEAALNGSIRRLDFYLDAHDSGVRQADRALGALWDGLGASGRRQEAIFAVVSLHGEALGEHGHWFSHGRTLHEEELEVPVLIRGPGVRAHEADAPESAIMLMDLYPTLLGALGLHDGFRVGDAINLAHYLRAPAALPRRYLHAGQAQPPFARAILGEYRYKLISTPPRPPMIHEPGWWTQTGENELYDLKTDPLAGKRLERSKGAIAHELLLALRISYPPWPGTPPAEDTSRRR